MRSALARRLNDAEVFNRLEILQVLLELGVDRELLAVLVVLEERPELLEPVQLARLVVADRLFLKDLVDVGPEALLEPVGEVAEQALEAVAEAGGGVFERQSAELVEHLAVEVAPQEERPEPEERVHFRRLANARTFALCTDQNTRCTPPGGAAEISVPLRHRAR